ncbi:MAG TPA: protease pro-enzyme activation domain-containing protein, partial [Jatrophihabitantaceae bacterium]
MNGFSAFRVSEGNFAVRGGEGNLITRHPEGKGPVPHLRLRSFVLAIVVATVGIGAATAQAQAARVWFPRNVLPLANATNEGPAPASHVMEIGIGLKDPNPAGERTLMAAQQDPSSSQYHKFLTPAQFNTQFGVADATFQQVLTWLRGGGANVIDTAGARNYVEVTATVGQVQQLFGTQINKYSARGVSFLANATPPSVPVGLDVLAVMGLNTLQHPTTPLTGAHTGSPAPGSSVLGKSTAPGSSVLASVGLGQASGTPEIPTALTPQDMWSIYQMPAVNTGQGQSIAIMGSGDSTTTVNDLAIFESHHSLPTVPVTVTKIPADGDFSDTGGNVEWELDTQASSGVAPDVTGEHLYFAQHLIDPDAEADFATWVSDPNGPMQANASFGECESTPANATLESTIPPQFNNNLDQNAMYGTGAPNNLEPVADQTLEQG